MLVLAVMVHMLKYAPMGLAPLSDADAPAHPWANVSLLRPFSALAYWHRDIRKMDLYQYPPQATTRRAAVPVPKAGGHRGRRRGHIRQDVACQQR